MTSARERALRRLGVPEQPTATKALFDTLSKAATIRQNRLHMPATVGVGKLVGSLPAHERAALDDLRSSDIYDVRPDLVRKLLRRF